MNLFHFLSPLTELRGLIRGDRMQTRSVWATIWHALLDRFPSCSSLNCSTARRTLFAQVEHGPLNSTRSARATFLRSILHTRWRVFRVRRFLQWIFFSLSLSRSKSCPREAVPSLNRSCPVPFLFTGCPVHEFCARQCELFVRIWIAVCTDWLIWQ